MGAIKDVIDLLSQLANKEKDRKLAGELSQLQSLILGIQSEHAELHEANTELREERLQLRERVQELEFQIKELSSASAYAPSDVPVCPNCSTTSKPFYMSPLGPRFVQVAGATHQCSMCKYKTNITT